MIIKQDFADVVEMFRKEAADRLASYVEVTHRMRRGKLVEIPEEWRGKITHKQTIRKRKSKKGQGASYKSKAQR